MKVHVFNHQHYYHTLESQIGHGIPVFTGYRQKGGGLGSILGFIGKYAIPLLTKYVLPHARTALINTVSDVSNGQPIKNALKTHGVGMLKNVGKAILNEQTGSGLNRNKRKKDIGFDAVVCSPPTKLKRSSVSSAKRQPSKQIKKKKSSNKKPKLISKRDIFG